MKMYFHNYIKVLKRNYMLVFMAIVLLVFTFFIWAGFPFFIIGSSVSNLTTNVAIIYFCISLSGGILFTLYFVPINLKVAKSMAPFKKQSVIRSFIQIQVIWIFICTVIFALALSILIVNA